METMDPYLGILPKICVDKYLSLDITDIACLKITISKALVAAPHPSPTHSRCR